MIFRTNEKEYRGTTAVEVVSSLAADAPEFTSGGERLLYEFLQWSLGQLGDRIPPRELEVSRRLADETLARNYLLLRDEYGVGQLIDERRGPTPL